jgi:hypothetical protein
MVSDELLAHLVRSTGLDRERLEWLIAEVTSAQAETVSDYVRRRHRECQAVGSRNSEIFQQLQRELRARRFAAPPLSERQLRRLVYG